MQFYVNFRADSSFLNHIYTPRIILSGKGHLFVKDAKVDTIWI